MPMFIYQSNIVERLIKTRQRTILAPTGSGKTLIALEVVNKLKKKALIIVHTSVLLQQWKDEIVKFFGIQEKQVGQLGGGKKKLEDVTVALIQTLMRLSRQEYEELNKHFGITIIDECHRVPASELFKSVNRLCAKHRYGFTGTTKRKDGLEFLLFDVVSHNIERIEEEELRQENRLVSVRVKFVPTCFNYEITLDRNGEEDLNWVDLIQKMVDNKERNKKSCNENSYRFKRY